MTGGAPRDDGFIATEWVIGIALLVVPTMLLVGVLPTWAARHEAAAAAAREAARLVVLADDPVQAEQIAAAGSAAVLADRGLVADDVRVVLPPAANDVLPREGVVEVTVTVPGEPVTIPGFGVLDLPAVRGSHARALDPFRSR